MITTRDERFIQMAIDMTKGLPKFGDGRIAAIIAIKGQLISTGFNIGKKHPMALKYARDRNPDCIFPHAEVCAIHNASKKLDLSNFSKTVLYVARSKKMEPGGFDVNGLAKPCEGCQRAIEAFGIRKVIYTTDDLIYEELFG